MQFEYDPVKSASNKDKHGIDFDEAQAIWNDENRLAARARVANEQRALMVGKIGERLWTAVYTLRAGAIRLISVRRARDDESDRYQDNYRR
jgi:uncharacterized DUF497 family protein